MSSTDAGSATSMGAAELGTIDMRLEVVTLPVSDVDRAKRFYQGLGWRLDIDLVVSDDFRIVQFTPLHSQCSIHVGKGITAAEPGSVDRLLLAVEDIDSARDALVSRGVDVSEVYHYETRPGQSPEMVRVPGPGPQEGRSYSTYASFSDPDGNGWLLQEITTRLPGREWEADTDAASLADLLHETAEHHDPFEKTHAPHNWWDWYAAYMEAREHGSTPDEASDAARRYMEDVLQVAAQ
jgi:catechol 2,3-dioxygenase-like lactoylglutathione lyase family enzyme